MDVVISADRQVVVSHDPWFSSDICSHPDGNPVRPKEEKRLRLYDLPYSLIKQFDCGVRGNPKFPEQLKEPAHKPLLKEVIELGMSTRSGRYSESPVRYNIETKCKPSGDGVNHPEPRTFVRLLYDVLIQTGSLRLATLQSFDVRTLQEARALDPTWKLALLVERFGAKGFKRNLKRLGFTPNIYSPHFSHVKGKLVRKAHERGVTVLPWTVNKEKEMIRVIDCGVDGLITDYPDRAATLLTEKGINY